MKYLNLTQGSKEWLDKRLKCFCASEAAAMMGASKYQSRDDLLKIKATGITPEVDSYTQSIFNKGHDAEEAARPLFAEIIGEDFFPVTGFLEIDGLPLLASFDGLTFDELIGFEHKLWNEKLSASIVARDIEAHYYWQLEQQLLVSGATKILFSTSDGTKEKNAFFFYESKPDRRAALIAGWKQFAIDLANYSLPEAEAAQAIAEPVETLPAITYETQQKSTGLELRSNIEAYKSAAMRLVEQSKKKLETDQDFANAELRIKSCKAAEDKIAAIQGNVVGEVADIDKFVKDLGAISEMLRQCRLNETKQVSARKEEIKINAIREAQESFAAHLNFICKGLSQYGVTLPVIHVDFAVAIKGLKTISSMHSKLNDAVAQGKIDAKAMENKIRGNLELLDHIAEGYSHLFYDKQNLVVNTSEYIVAVAKQRIAEFEEKAKRIASEKIAKDRMEAERLTQIETQGAIEVHEQPAQVLPTEESETTSSHEQSAQAQIDAALIKLKTLEYVLKLFEECAKNSELDFREELVQMINATKLPRKVA